MSFIGGPQDLFSLGLHGCCESVVELMGCQHCDAAVVVLVVVIGEERGEEGAGVLDATEPLWKRWQILEGLELSL